MSAKYGRNRRGRCRQQCISHSAHRRNDDNGKRRTLCRNNACDVLDGSGVGYGRPAKFHHDWHSPQITRIRVVRELCGLAFLCATSVSSVSLWCGFTRNSSTTETQRTQRLHREKRNRTFAPSLCGLSLRRDVFHKLKFRQRLELLDWQTSGDDL